MQDSAVIAFGLLFLIVMLLFLYVPMPWRKSSKTVNSHNTTTVNKTGFDSREVAGLLQQQQEQFQQVLRQQQQFFAGIYLLEKQDRQQERQITAATLAAIRQAIDSGIGIEFRGGRDVLVWPDGSTVPALERLKSAEAVDLMYQTQATRLLPGA